MPRPALKQNPAALLLKEQLRRIGWNVDGFLVRLRERGWQLDRAAFSNYCRATTDGVAKPKRHNTGFRGQPALVTDIVHVLVLDAPPSRRWSPAEAIAFAAAAEQPPELLFSLARIFDDIAAFEHALAAHAASGDEALSRVADVALAALPLHTTPPRAPLPRRGFGALPPAAAQLFGGESLLRTLAYALKTTPQLRLALVGMPGLGKTALAVEVALRYGQFFQGGVFVVMGDTAARLRAGLIALGIEGLGLGAFVAALPEDQQLRAVREALERAPHCLLLLDNVEGVDGDEIVALLPQTGNCRVLATSRSSLSRLGGWGEIVLRPLAPADSVALVQQLSGMPEAERPGLHDLTSELARRLGELPLGLTLVAALLRDDPLGHRHALERLIDELREGGPASHMIPLDRTIGYFVNRLDPEHPILGPARALLALATTFAPGQQIDRALLRMMAASSYDAGSIAGGAIPYYDEALRELRARSLVTAAGEASLIMHRLVREQARARLDLRAAIARAGEFLWRLLVEDGGEAIEHIGPRALLVQSVAEDSAQLGLPYAAQLCYLLGWYYTRNSEHEQALWWGERALALALDRYGPEHVVTAEAWCRLGLARLFRSEFAAAREAFAAMQAIHGHIYPVEHLERQIGVLNVAQVMVIDGEYAQGEALARAALRVLRSLERTGGAGGQAAARVRRALRILAQTAIELGRPWKAYRLIGLACRRSPEGQAVTAQLLFDRGFRATVIGRYLEARQCFTQSMELRAALHEGRRDEDGHYWHQDVAETWQGLGYLELCLGNLGAAEAALSEARAIYAVTLGERSLESGEAMELSGEVALQAGRLAEAQRRFEEAAAIFRRVFASERINQLLRTELRLARLAMVKGDLGAARVLLEGVRHRCDERGTPTHTLALWAALLLAEIARREGHAESAEALRSGALPLLRRAYRGHPAIDRLYPEVALNPLVILV